MNYRKIEKLFTENDTKEIIKKYDPLCVEKGRVGTVTDKSIDDKGEYDTYFRESLVYFINPDCQFSKYTKNNYFNWHQDFGRSYTIVILLNDEFEGGNFEMLNMFSHGDLGIHDTKLKVGDCIMLPASIHHRVSPIKEGVRYSLTMWHR
mgnify:CR=1 FL=1|tara:strand:+ start:1170 stop:1616 length:447 start_codon:yes stop_codon:yes gene_type:complete